jgi:hypothetical protein
MTFWLDSRINPVLAAEWAGHLETSHAATTWDGPAFRAPEGPPSLNRLRSRTGRTRNRERPTRRRAGRTFRALSIARGPTQSKKDSIGPHPR